MYTDQSYYITYDMYTTLSYMLSYVSIFSFQRKMGNWFVRYQYIITKTQHSACKLFSCQKWYWVCVVYWAQTWKHVIMGTFCGYSQAVMKMLLMFSVAKQNILRAKTFKTISLWTFVHDQLLGSYYYIPLLSGILTCSQRNNLFLLPPFILLLCKCLPNWPQLCSGANSTQKWEFW